MDTTTKWLVKIACVVFIGGVIATPIYLKQQKLEKFCREFSKEYGWTTDLEIKMRKDCIKAPRAYGYSN